MPSFYQKNRFFRILKLVRALKSLNLGGDPGLQSGAMSCLSLYEGVGILRAAPKKSESRF